MKKVLFISLGCDKNLVDSEYMLGLLADKGYQIIDDESDADIIVINTCGFIGDAKQESINAIVSMAKLKKTGKCQILGVCGCLAERFRDIITDEIKEVDFVLGTNSSLDIINAIEQCKASPYYRFDSLDYNPDISNHNRLVTTGGFYAYLKIAEGCDKRCTYCAIPDMRGSYRSFPIETLVAQARKLASNGVKELILVAQETTLYGTDLYGEKSLYRLLDELNSIDGLVWIRIMYCYPEEIDDVLISSIIRNKKVLHYLDVPMQHASDNILRKMGRHTTGEALADIIDKLRANIPDICIRTSLITGFPGESEEDFIALMEFLNWAELDRVGVFAYSREEGTLAYDFDDQIDEDIKIARRDEAMELLMEISADKQESYIGKVFNCFVEGYSAKEDVYVARSYRDAPGVDGYVFIKSNTELNTGDFVDVMITDSKDYDLVGELYERS